MTLGLETRETPVRSEGALGPYLRAIRKHRLLVVAITAVTVLAAGAWLYVRAPSYEATAEILVSPLPQSDTTFLGVQVLRDSTEPTRTMQTAASMLSTRQTAQRTAARLGPGWDTQRVEDAVKVKPQGESNIVAVTATDDDADPAARVANVYATSALEQRHFDLARQVQAAVAGLRPQQRAEQRRGVTSSDVQRRLTQLRLVGGGIDPTFSLSAPAAVPESPLGPPSWLVLVLALLAGWTIASVTAVLIEAVVRTSPSPLPPDPFE